MSAAPLPHPKMSPAESFTLNHRVYHLILVIPVKSLLGVYHARERARMSTLACPPKPPTSRFSGPQENVQDLLEWREEINATLGRLMQEMDGVTCVPGPDSLTRKLLPAAGRGEGSRGALVTAQANFTGRLLCIDTLFPRRCPRCPRRVLGSPQRVPPRFPLASSAPRAPFHPIPRA